MPVVVPYIPVIITGGSGADPLENPGGTAAAFGTIGVLSSFVVGGIGGLFNSIPADENKFKLQRAQEAFDSADRTLTSFDADVAAGFRPQVAQRWPDYEELQTVARDPERAAAYIEGARAAYTEHALEQARERRPKLVAAKSTALGALEQAQRSVARSKGIAVGIAVASVLAGVASVFGAETARRGWVAEAAAKNEKG